MIPRIGWIWQNKLEIQKSHFKWEDVGNIGLSNITWQITDFISDTNVRAKVIHILGINRYYDINNKFDCYIGNLADGANFWRWLAKDIKDINLKNLNCEHCIQKFYVSKFKE